MMWEGLILHNSRTDRPEWTNQVRVNPRSPPSAQRLSLLERPLPPSYGVQSLCVKVISYM